MCRLRAQRQLEDSEDEDDEEEPVKLLVSRTELVESSCSELLPVPARDLNRQGLSSGVLQRRQLAAGQQITWGGVGAYGFAPRRQQRFESFGRDRHKRCLAGRQADARAALCCTCFRACSCRELLVSFQGEPGYGAGVTREWLSLLSAQLFRPELGLFVRCGGNPLAVMFNPGARLAAPASRFVLRCAVLHVSRTPAFKLPLCA